MWSTGKKYPARESRNVAATRSTPCTPLKTMAVTDNPRHSTPSSHATPNSCSGDSPYIRAKHVQTVDKDLQKSIPLFWAAINNGDRVDSALKDMALIMKQVNRTEEAIEAVKSFRYLCSPQAQESLDNVLLDLYKKCGRIDDQIELLNFKLKMIDNGLAFGGRRTKLTRSKGKKFHVSLDHEKSRLLGNLGWAYMQSGNFEAAEPLYRKALAIEQDYNKQCNLAICLMKRGRFEEAKSILHYVERALIEICDEFSLKSFERASKVLMELELHDNLNGKKNYALKEDATFGSGKQEQSQNLHNISLKTNRAGHALERAASTIDCRILRSNTLHHNSALIELDGGNSSSSSIVSGKSSRKFKDIGTEEFGILSMRCREYLDFASDSTLIGSTGQTLDATVLPSDRTAEQEHVSLNHRERSHILKPKSLNKFWTTEPGKTPKAKSNGSLPTRMDVNWNKESSAFIDNGKQIDNSEGKTPTGGSKKYQFRFSESNSASNTEEEKTDRNGIALFLTGETRTWADLVEEEPSPTHNFSREVTATDTSVVASENCLKTQLIKKSERKTWPDLVEEEVQFATQKLSIDVAAIDKNVDASDNYINTQLVQKNERRTWADMVEEEEFLANVSHSSSKDATQTIESNRDLSEEYFKTPLLFKSGSSTWLDHMPEEDGSLPDENSRNGSAVDPNSSVRRALSFDPSIDYQTTHCK